jgi:hypothetical protein
MKKFAIISSLLILPSATFIYPVLNKYFKKEERKDYTRFNSKYYGLSWGSNTDEEVMNI